MNITPKIIVGFPADPFPIVDGDIVLYYKTNGNIYLRVFGNWSRLDKRSAFNNAEARIGERIQVTAANQENYIPFDHPFPFGSTYVLIPTGYNSNGSIGLTVTRKDSDGFYINPIEECLCDYIAVRK